MAKVTETKACAPARTVSKKKYQEIHDELLKAFDEEIKEAVLHIIRKVLALDPNMSAYKPEHGQKLKEWRRQKMQEFGVSSYLISGRKAQYINANKKEEP
jgi:hypothetical protein